ncbi:ATP-dependent RNA helicase RhlB, partial [Lysobacter sp. ISL-54]|uniref:ATP-dependent RNA helicase RhlB n=1 Tax=Lysobacter sp. ISL-54 TaxID=2819155 RepID=UPI001BEA8649
ANPAEGERAPRKRRRRHGGRRIEGAEGANPAQDAGASAAVAKPSSAGAPRPQSAKPAASKPAAPAAGEAKPSLLGRIGRKLKSLVARPPRTQH